MYIYNLPLCSQVCLLSERKEKKKKKTNWNPKSLPFDLAHTATHIYFCDILHPKQTKILDLVGEEEFTHFLELEVI